MSRSKLQAFLGISKSSRRAGREGHLGGTSRLLRPALQGVCARVCRGSRLCSTPIPQGPLEHPGPTATTCTWCGILKPLGGLWAVGRVWGAAAREPNCRAWLGLLQGPPGSCLCGPAGRVPDCPDQPAWRCARSIRHGEAGLLRRSPLCLSLPHAVSDENLLCVVLSP